MEYIKTNKKLIIVAIVALIVGLMIGSCSNRYEGKRFYNRGGERSGYMMKGGDRMRGRMMDGKMSSMDHMMVGMTGDLEGKTGEEFDKAFLSGMIVHHQGAVAMAEMALKNAKQQEIKNLSKAIIEAQNREIAEMQSWQKAWYTK